MIPYVFLFLNVSLLLLAAYQIRSNIFFLITFFILAIFAGVRKNVGVDFDSYNEMFNSIRAGTLLFEIEPLNMVIVYLADYLGFGNQCIFFIYAVVIMIGVYFFIKKFSPSKELSLLIFVTIGVFYLSTFNGIRQWAAISMSLIALVKAYESKYVQSAGLVLIAVLFHFSAIVFVSLPLLLVRWQFKSILKLLLVLYIGIDVFLYLIELTKYSIYLDLIKFEKTPNIPILLSYMTFMFLSLFYFGYFDRTAKVQRSTILLLNMNLASFLIFFIGFTLKLDYLSLMRVNNYFEMQLVILLPMILDRLSNMHLRAAVGVSLVAFCVSYFFYTVYINGETYVLVPYQL